MNHAFFYCHFAGEYGIISTIITTGTGLIGGLKNEDYRRQKQISDHFASCLGVDYRSIRAGSSPRSRHRLAVPGGGPWDSPVGLAYGRAGRP
jgi:hypothetical protein